MSVSLLGCGGNPVKETGRAIASGVVDSTLGIPASDAVESAGDIIKSANSQERKENVEKLNKAYADYLRLRDDTNPAPENQRSPILLESNGPLENESSDEEKPPEQVPSN